MMSCIEKFILRRSNIKKQLILQGGNRD